MSLPVIRDTADTVAIFDPRTGEQVDLATHPHEGLVDVFIELRRREDQLKEWRTAVEDELTRRHGDSKATQVVGAFEIGVERPFARVWDVDDLTAAVSELAARGLLDPQDVAGLTKQERKVDGRKALALLNRASEEALVELRRCFHWEPKGRAKLSITPLATLEEPAE